eukprot:9186520-Lingulodinium_polyedra.AAC.1
MRGALPPLAVAMAMDVSRGTRLVVLAGPPGAAKTDAGSTLAFLLLTFARARVLMTSHANRSVA